MKKTRVNLDDVFSENCSEKLNEKIEEVSVDKAASDSHSLGQVDHNDVRIYDIDVSKNGIKIGKVYTGKIVTYSIALTIIICSVLYFT